MNSFALRLSQHFCLALAGALVTCALAACGEKAEPDLGVVADQCREFLFTDAPPAAALEVEGYDSLQQMTIAADLVVRASVAEAVAGPLVGPRDDRFPTTVLRLEPIEVLAGEVPDGGPIKLNVFGVAGSGIETCEQAAGEFEGTFFLRSSESDRRFFGARPARGEDRSAPGYRITNWQGSFVDDPPPGYDPPLSQGWAAKLKRAPYERTLTEVRVAAERRALLPDDGKAQRKRILDGSR